MDQISHYINDIKTIQQEMRKLFEQEDEEKDELFEACSLKDDDIIDMLECMDEYINEHPKLITDPDFDEIFLQEMQTLFPCCENTDEIIELFHIWFLPKRSQQEEEEEEEVGLKEEDETKEREVIKQKISYFSIFKLITSPTKVPLCCSINAFSKATTVSFSIFPFSLIKAAESLELMPLVCFFTSINSLFLAVMNLM